MEALDSAYSWGINKQNAGNLSDRQRIGLSSLAPEAGYGLGTGSPSTRLNPYGALPRPQFSDDANNHFNFEYPAVQNGLGNLFLGDVKGDPNADRSYFPQMEAKSYAPTDANGLPSGKPYFDPNYPFQSMLALREWLGPQVEKGIAPALAARGMSYSGAAEHAGDRINSYLDQLAPRMETPGQALSYDMNYLYGPNIANSLASGDRPFGDSYLGEEGTVTIPGPLAGGQKFGDGSTSANALFVKNPGYKQGEPYPQFGLYDLNSGGLQYSGPGYQYDPLHAPDPKMMPWLADAKTGA